MSAKALGLGVSALRRFPRRLTPFILLLMAAFPVGLGDDEMTTGVMTYQITTTWDNQPLDHDPVTVTFIGRGDEGVEIKVDAPFFGVPGNPGGDPGKPFDKLWEYEVVEVFFADGNVNKPKYLEVELSPWGQHLVLLLDGAKTPIRTLLPINYTATISGNRWTGSAIIPADYFPPKVTRFNAYAIHDVITAEGDPRRYESLFPVPSGQYEAADFHRLDYFCPINFELLQQGNDKNGVSKMWSATLLRTNAAKTILADQNLEGGEVLSRASLFMIGMVDDENAWLNISLSAVFMNSGSNVPNGTADTPLPEIDLDTYETTRAYIANDEGKILETIFSPYGLYDIRLYSAPYNLISRGHRIDVKISGPDRTTFEWTAEAKIPLELLPAKISKISVASVYTMNNEVHFESVYKLNNAEISLPDLMVLSKYKGATPFSEGVNDAYSDLWDVEN